MTDNPTLPLVDWLRKVAPKHKEGTARKLAFNMDGLCLQELNAKINEAADALEAAQRRVSELEAALVRLVEAADAVAGAANIGTMDGAINASRAALAKDETARG